MINGPILKNMLNPNKIIIRKVESDDDRCSIARLIYSTDPYIYPALFGDMKIAIKLIPKLMDQNVIFNKKNIRIAVVDEKIVGIALIVCSPNFNRLSTEFLPILSTQAASFDVAEKYFNHISEDLYDNDTTIEIVCLSVDADYRKRHVGTSLLESIVNEYPEKNIILDVLAENISAIQLYEKAGFKYSEQPRKGYAYRSKPPLCYRMTKLHSTTSLRNN